MQVFHVMLGLVKGTLFTTFFQVFSREILTWLVCFVNPRVSIHTHAETESLAASALPFVCPPPTAFSLSLLGTHVLCLYPHNHDARE